MKICLCQPIFAPNEEMLNKNLNSLESLKIFKGKVDFYFSGWAKEEYWEKIDQAVNILEPKKYLKQEKNFGKAFNINTLTKELGAFDILLTMDSDIIFVQDYNYITNITSLFESIPDLGILSLNQLEANCHLNAHLNETKVVNGHRLTFNRGGGGIAGGCLAIDFNLWKDIGGYRLMGVYAGDDGFLFVDAKNRGKFCALANTISVIHPREADQEYAEWKGMVCHRDSNGRIKYNIDDQVKEAMNFWENR